MHALFDEPQPHSLSVSSPGVPETTSTATVHSFSSSEFPEVQAMSSASQHHPCLVDDIPTSPKSSSSSLLLDSDSESRLAPSPIPFSSPHGLPSSQAPKEGVETTTQDRVIPNAAQVAPSSVAEWRLQVQSRLPLQPVAPTIPQTSTESLVSSISDCHVSSATSLQTTLE